ncbi:MAG: hypothetical protein WCI57_05570 [Candidatus Berkelbacteria bacterium]
MARIEEIKEGDYWLDRTGTVQLITIINRVIRPNVVFGNNVRISPFKVFNGEIIEPSLLLRKLTKDQASEHIAKQIQRKVDEINEILILDLKVTFTPEESATDKGGT